jgi:hypothetical protein
VNVINVMSRVPRSKKTHFTFSHKVLILQGALLLTLYANKVKCMHNYNVFLVYSLESSPKLITQFRINLVVVVLN